MTLTTGPGADIETTAARVEAVVRGTGGVVDCAVVASGGGGPEVRCHRCGIPSAHPGTAISADGVCAQCALLAEHGPAMMSWFGEPGELAPLLRDAAARGSSDVDCLLLFSGGKDSTYVLYRLVDMGLRVMTFTFDNGFISTTALRNVERVTSELGIEHVTATRADQKRVFRESLEQHKSVCNGCFRSLLELSTELAHSRGIPTIVTGLSRGQIMDERLSWFHSRGLFNRAEIERGLQLGRQVYHRSGEQDDGVGAAALDSVEVVDFYRYSDVTKDEIRALLRERSDIWRQPSDTGFCSSNCIVNDVGVYVHTTERGYHNYEAPTRWEVRLGHLSRAEADAELQVPEPSSRVTNMLASIGYPDPRDRGHTGERLTVHCVTAPGTTVEDVRAAVALELPATLLPAHWAGADRIPRVDGRVDRAALPVPTARAAGVHGTPLPLTPVRHDGEVLEPTPAQRAVVATHRGSALSGAGRAVLVTAPDDVRSGLVAATRRAGLALLLHHDALRLRRDVTTGALRTVGPAGARPVVRLDLSAVPADDEPDALRRAVDRLRTRIDPAVGSPWQVAAVDRGGRPPALLVVAHALAVDPRSWQVLLEDLTTAVLQAGSGAPVVLPPRDGPAGHAPGPGAVPGGSRLAGLPPAPDDPTLLSHVPAAGAADLAAALAAALAPVEGLAGAVEVVDHTDGRNRPRAINCIDAPVVIGRGPALVRYDHVGDPAELLPAGSPFAVTALDGADLRTASATALASTGAALAGPAGDRALSLVGTLRDGRLELAWRVTGALRDRIVELDVPGRLARLLPPAGG